MPITKILNTSRLDLGEMTYTDAAFILKTWQVRGSSVPVFMPY